MDQISLFIKWFWVTTYILFSMFWFEYYGVATLILMYILGVWISFTDLVLGYYVSHRKGIITSRIFNDWVVEKLTKWMQVGIAIAIIGNFIYMSHNDIMDDILAMIAFWLIFIVSYGENISVVENLILVSTGPNQKVLKFIARIMGIWYDYVERKIDKKIEEVTGVKQ
jgi:hypothetical protein